MERAGANPEDTQLGVAFQIMMEMLPFHAVAILCFPDVLEPERLDLTIENYLHETFVENNRDTTIESDKAEKARLEHLEELRNLHAGTRAPGSAGLEYATNELNGDDGFGGEYQFRFASRKSGEHRTKAGTSAELKQSAKQSIGWSSMPSLPSMETFFSDGDNLEKAQQITEEDIQLLDADGNEIGPVMKVDTTSGVGAEMVDLQVKAMAEDQQKADCSGLDDNLTAEEQYDKMKKSRDSDYNNSGGQNLTQEEAAEKVSETAAALGVLTALATTAACLSGCGHNRCLGCAGSDCGGRCGGRCGSAPNGIRDKERRQPA